MLRPARRLLLTFALASAAIAGCVTPAGDTTTGASVDVDGARGEVLGIVPENAMLFAESVVTAAVGTATDLYEPTLEVSDTGTIYVAGHTIAAATTGTPAYYSRDDGKTWAPLPFVGALQAPPPGQGSQPPPGDEGFLVAGADGQAWMADIYLAGFSVTGWCNDGAEQCFDNRNAYDRVATLTAPCDAQGSLNDRPWAAYANGTLLLVNNPGGGPMQIGAMKVPPATPVGLGGGLASVSGPTWNYCASEGGSIPGVPAMREDGLFAVPQMMGGDDDSRLGIVMGNAADISDVETKTAFFVTHVGAGTSNGGRAAFDREGTLFVGAKNNTRGEEREVATPTGTSTVVDPAEGRFILAASTDDGATFQNATFSTGSPVRSLYLDGNMAGAGALLVWSQVGDDESKSDWYVAHVFVGPDGAPELRHVALAVDEGPPSSAHVMGAGAGPDGRAYFVTFVGGAPAEYAGSNPLRVWVQQEGPTLPVTMPLADE